LISLTGRCHVSRVGLSILNSIGMASFAASTGAQYVTRAAVLADNRDNPAILSGSMRRRMLQSPLCDTEGFAHSPELIYRDMWRSWGVSCKVMAGRG